MTQQTKILPAESLTAYERWELPNHNPPPPPPPPPVAEEVPAEEVEPLTLEQIEQIQREAYEEGFRLGKEEGFAAGRKEGLQSGLQAGQQEIRAEVQRLHQIIEAFAEPLADVDEQVEDELTQLAVTIARHLLRREIRTDPNQIIGVVREAMSALPAHSRKVQVYLHPADAAIVRENMQLGDREEEAWRIVEEPVLTRGGCRIVTEHSQVDATIEKRLNAVVAALFGGERASDRGHE